MVTIAGKKCGALTCLGGRGQGMCRMHESYLPKRGRGWDFLSEESSVGGWGNLENTGAGRKKGGGEGQQGRSAGAVPRGDWQGPSKKLCFILEQREAHDRF